MKVRYTSRAARQLEAILDHIEHHSSQGAQRVMDRMEAALQVLAEHPNAGQATDQVGLRRVVVSPYPYVILYQPTAAEIIVHGDRHAARRPRG